jgi:hypothetical protein
VADVVPIVARELPELPRPLKNWGAPWLLREILATRDQRLPQEIPLSQPVEAPPPVQRTPAEIPRLQRRQSSERAGQPACHSTLAAFGLRHLGLSLKILE